MNLLEWLDPAFCSRLCLTLLHSLWQVALLAAIARLVEHLVRKQSVQRSYTLHAVALTLAIAALPITYTTIDLPASPLQRSGAPQKTPQPQPQTPPPPPIAVEKPPTVQPHQTTAAPPPTPSTTPENTPAPPVWQRTTPWLAGLYALGVAIMFIRLLRGMVNAQQLGQRAQPIKTGPLSISLQNLCRQWSIRVAPTLAVANHLVVPKVVGLVKPTILLPATALTGLSTDELEMILTHELAHIRRHDMWVNLLQRLAEVVLFFNPALWYLSRRISTLREYCCDEMTCQAMAGTTPEPQLRYATALLRVVELAQPSEAAHSELASLAASGRSPSELRRRVARLFGEPVREPLRISRAGVIVLVSISMLLIIDPVIWPTNAQTTDNANEIKQAYHSSTTEVDRIVAAARKKTFAPHLINNRFILCPVTTDLQRSLLGSVASPATNVSICVFVNANSFDSLDSIDRKAEGVDELVTKLFETSLDDNREISFRIIGDTNDPKTSEHLDEWMDAIETLVRKLSKSTGYENVRVAQSFGGYNWGDMVKRARQGSKSNRVVEKTTQSERIRLTPISTFLSHLLVNAGYAVDFLPIVRDADNVRFRDDVLPAVAEAVKKAKPMKGKNLLIRIRYSKTEKQELEGWINDFAARKAYAKNLGFELCNVSMSQIAESEEIVQTDDYSAEHSMTIRIVDTKDRPVIGAKVTQAQWLATSEGMRPTKKKNQDYFTDSDGAAIINWTGESKDLRIWVTKPGYVPMHAMWSKDFQTDGDKLPAEFQIELQAGTEIGGQVTDVDGEPIENVKVEVTDATRAYNYIYRSNKPGLRPLRTPGLAEVLTDSKGRWTAKNIPSNIQLVFPYLGGPENSQPSTFLPIRLKFTHPDYPVITQRPSIESLRRKSAVLAMSGKKLSEEDLESEPYSTPKAISTNKIINAPESP